MKCIGAIVNVCAICDVVYYVDVFLTLLCENTKVSNYYTIEIAKLISKREEICKKYLLKTFAIKMCSTTHVNLFL